MSEVMSLKQQVKDAIECLDRAKKRVAKIEKYKRPAPSQLQIAKKEVALRTRQLSNLQGKLIKALGIASK